LGVLLQTKSREKKGAEKKGISEKSTCLSHFNHAMIKKISKSVLFPLKRGGAFVVSSLEGLRCGMEYETSQIKRGRMQLRWSGGLLWVSFGMLLMACGCGKKVAPRMENVYTNRANDAVYMKMLTQRSREQAQQSSDYFQTRRQMTQCVERVRGTLPAGTDDKALQVSLAADPEWQTLIAQEKRQRAQSEQLLADAKEMIRRRMLDEEQASRAVKEGKALSVDAVAPSSGTSENRKF